MTQYEFNVLGKELNQRRGSVEYNVDIEDYNLYLDDIIAECGAIHYADHDGWEDQWPIKFYIFHEGLYIGCGYCDMEMTPYFSCGKTEIADETPQHSEAVAS